MGRNLLGQIRNGKATVRKVGKGMKSTAGGKDRTALDHTRHNSNPEAAPSGDPGRCLPAGGNGKGGTKKEGLKGCLMCGACGSVGHCVLD